MKKTYQYQCNCIESSYELISAMIDQAKEVSLSVVRKHCQEIEHWAKDMGYAKNSRSGLTLKNDWHVAYYKSFYDSKPCYFIRHSAIEYIWVILSSTEANSPITNNN
jgi:hypothetical protein